MIQKKKKTFMQYLVGGFIAATALTYIFAPADLIPDAIGLLGFFDDAFATAFAFIGIQRVFSKWSIGISKVKKHYKL